MASAALSFNFSFAGTGQPATPTTVTGTVSGLVDNLPNQTTGLKVIITSATNTPPGAWPTFSTDFDGDGFDVAQGQITGVTIAFRDQGKFLYFGNQGILNPQLEDPTSDPVYENFAWNQQPTNSLRFTPLAQPTASVPGPLPLLAAAAGFGWSRRLRRRVRSPL